MSRKTEKRKIKPSKYSILARAYTGIFLILLLLIGVCYSFYTTYNSFERLTPHWGYAVVLTLIVQIVPNWCWWVSKTDIPINRAFFIVFWLGLSIFDILTNVEYSSVYLIPVMQTESALQMSKYLGVFIIYTIDIMVVFSEEAIYQMISVVSELFTSVKRKSSTQNNKKHTENKTFKSSKSKHSSRHSSGRTPNWDSDDED